MFYRTLIGEWSWPRKRLPSDQC